MDKGVHGNHIRGFPWSGNTKDASFSTGIFLSQFGALENEEAVAKAHLNAVLTLYRSTFHPALPDTCSHSKELGWHESHSWWQCWAAQ